MFVTLTGAVLVVLSTAAGQSQGQCKSPVVEKRLLADDVRFASPFYVVALPRNSDTLKMDNICYTYYETGTGSFNHIMSVTYRDGKNKYHSFMKGDISDQMGLAEAKAADGTSCTFHDYTLVPICNSTVFILYRCYIEGACTNIDITPNPKVDTRVVLAATPTVSQECYKEVDKSLKDTSVFKGGDYIILPQGLPPQCVTKYNNNNSIGYKRAKGSKEVSDDVNNRFNDEVKPVKPSSVTQKNPVQTQPPKPTQMTWQNQNNSPVNNQGVKAPNKPTGSTFQSTVTGPGFTGSYAFSHASSGGQSHGYMPQQNWGQNEWSTGQNPWRQPERPGEMHYHTWQSHTNGHPQPANMEAKPDALKGNNVFYHIHSWDTPPPGCCKCNNNM